ncbi:hypothetical protein [Mycolicibacterium brisbanense]|uniref:Uncharacterized protein n=1 Tax=Mycolicibacterium brisbanense TaxID=146020 RepID=A0A100VX67_9MYCO|nr:hypothetical protein [Mycolicibacterium brisbanense]MCV7159367.1 hypothetical protein [Mycolicibacterium brisbanense]GAS87546.1 uncharacterized protein RMCB_1642 [Mycolicibacterium brisbanense]
MTHSDSMMIHEPVLPVGAESADSWEPGDSEFPPYRIVSGSERRVTDSDIEVKATAIQWANGSIEDGTVDECPKIWINRTDLNSDQSRELAAHLLELAALVDGWVRR